MMIFIPFPKNINSNRISSTPRHLILLVISMLIIILQHHHQLFGTAAANFVQQSPEKNRILINNSHNFTATTSSTNRFTTTSTTTLLHHQEDGNSLTTTNRRQDLIQSTNPTSTTITDSDTIAADKTFDTTSSTKIGDYEPKFDTITYQPSDGTTDYNNSNSKEAALVDKTSRFGPTNPIASTESVGGKSVQTDKYRIYAAEADDSNEADDSINNSDDADDESYRNIVIVVGVLISLLILCFIIIISCILSRKSYCCSCCILYCSCCCCCCNTEEDALNAADSLTQLTSQQCPKTASTVDESAERQRIKKFWKNLLHNRFTDSYSSMKDRRKGRRVRFKKFHSDESQRLHQQTGSHLHNQHNAKPSASVTPGECPNSTEISLLIPASVNVTEETPHTGRKRIGALDLTSQIDSRAVFGGSILAIQMSPTSSIDQQERSAGKSLGAAAGNGGKNDEVDVSKREDIQSPNTVTSTFSRGASSAGSAAAPQIPDKSNASSLVSPASSPGAGAAKNDHRFGSSPTTATNTQTSSSNTVSPIATYFSFASGPGSPKNLTSTPAAFVPLRTSTPSAKNSNGTENRTHVATGCCSASIEELVAIMDGKMNKIDTSQQELKTDDTQTISISAAKRPV